MEQLKKEQKHLRQPERFTSDFERGFIRAEIVAMMILWIVEPIQRQRKKDLSDWKEKNMLCRMEILFYSDSMCRD